ncbi:serine/threonine protein kinase [Persicimonas caeni]|uniref:Serine/threonine protein kinase n=1 Tax=Persicimonas caeni TaxID=2292766 RepID=A0A4Y6PR21_PERCE|nr:serine/threonine-protein kinase [Persicimonas caeni]QDG50235.1 serine/threonine protein kinase [Persicimonas caeni]QED31456.1 serine/threonine protein kinase [Persicimonas caeni]
MSDDQSVSDSFFDVSGLPDEDVGDDDDLLVGSVLDGRYRLDRLLGEGGMGRVYAGTQLSIEREVAIKLLRGEALAQREVKERFLREAKVISGFSHPNIVRLIDYGEDRERRLPYLVMELVRGVSLGELTRRGRLELPLALEIAYQVCGALVQAHAAGIVHRDLKPDNLQLVPVVGDSFQTKVLDFGIAFPSDANSRLTSTGMICGTSYYIAPEQARAQELDGRADLYALGIILYEMLSGQLPFSGDSDFQILLMQVQQPPPPLADYLPPEEVPPEVIKLVHDLLAKAPDERPPSARAVRERIEVIRRRCAISPLKLDLEDASADAFERWILPPSDNAPIINAATEFDVSTPAEAVEKLASRRHTLVEDGGPTEQMAEVDGTPDADSETAPTQEASAEASSGGAGSAWLIAALVACIAVAGGVAAYLATADESDDPDEAATAVARKADDAPDVPHDDSRQDERPRPVPDNVPITAFAGRCMVIGESDTWFHSVFLYPEVGELMLQGDERLLWSRVDMGERQGKTATFSYEVPVDDKPESSKKKSQTLEARASADKLIFKLPEKKSKFVCRKHDVQKYYDTLDLTGTFVDADDKERTLVVPSSGQRLEIGGAEYAYRILDGRTPADGHLLALREADADKAKWQPTRLSYDADAGALTLGEGERAQRFVSEAALEEAARAEKKRRRKKKRSPKPASKPTPTQPAPQQAPAAAQPGWQRGPASQEVVDKYRKELRAVVQRFCDAQDDHKQRIEHYQSLLRQGRKEDAKAYHEAHIKDGGKLRDEMTTISHTYSNILQRAIYSGVTSLQIQQMPSLSNDACK